MRPRNPFTEHPRMVNETYVEHMGVAFTFAGRMMFGALACLVHGLFPFLCVRTGSRLVTDLHQRMVTHRERHGRPVALPAE